MTCHNCNCRHMPRTFDFCPFCGERLKGMQGPERRLVGESRSDGPTSGAEVRSMEDGGVGKIVERDELVRRVNAMIGEARMSENYFNESDEPVEQARYNGRKSALIELRRIISDMAAERSDLPNDKG